MHLRFNLQKEILHHYTTCSEEYFYFPEVLVSQVDDEIHFWGQTIPTSWMEIIPRSLSGFGKLKATEQKSFFLNLCLVLLDGYLSIAYMDVLMILVEFFDLCTWAELTKIGDDRLESLELRFFYPFEQHYYNYDIHKVSMCKSQFHMLLHLREIITECGPLVVCSQLGNERMVGWEGDILHAQNMITQIVLLWAMSREQCRIFYKHHFFQ